MWRPLNFRILKIEMLTTSDKKTVDSFKHHIWNQHILLVNILEFEENRRRLLMSRPSVHSSHPHNKGFFQFFLTDFRQKIETSFLVHQ